MNVTYHIDMDSQVPIYQQLVDEIRAAVKMGTLPSGHQLPTVLQLAQELGLARGTVKRAYDELERQGLVEKVQGRGTFVCYQAPSASDRKDQAMAAIDAMLDRMAELGFSMAEVNIFLNLKLREREERLSSVRVAVVECNPENLSRITEQLRAVEGVELYSHLLEQIRAYPYRLGEEMDLVVTSAEHGEYLQSILPEKKKIARIALRLSPASMARIVKLRSDESVGVLGCSQRFADLLRQACVGYTEQVRVAPAQEFSDAASLREYLRGKTTVLVPDGYEKYTDPESAALLRQFEKRGKLIPCAYEMDEGSFLFLQEKIGRLHERKMR